MNNLCPTFRVKRDVNLFEDLKQFGFSYCGNYFRGENWHREMSGIDNDAPVNGIVIHGDWDGRRIFFKFQYRNNLEKMSVGPFIRDLIAVGIVEQEAQENGEE